MSTSYATMLTVGDGKDLRRLSRRANYAVHSVREKPLVLYEDHRSLVFVLWHAMHSVALLEKPALLIYFDGHDDAKPISPAALSRIRELRAGKATEREVFDLVEWELSPLDDDWLIAAMELGVVGDAICIGAETKPNLDAQRGVNPEPIVTERRLRLAFDGGQPAEEIPRLSPAQTGAHFTYFDHRGEEHRVWPLHHLWTELDSRGALGDFVRVDDFGALWDVLGWDASAQRLGTTPDLPPVVLDFDLDCFAGHVNGSYFAWPEKIFRRFSKHVGERGVWSAEAFLSSLEERVAFRSIAHESPYCGGSFESQTILARLDRALWAGELLGED